MLFLARGTTTLISSSINHLSVLLPCLVISQSRKFKSRSRFARSELRREYSSIYLARSGTDSLDLLRGLNAQCRKTLVIHANPILTHSSTFRPVKSSRHPPCAFPTSCNVEKRTCSPHCGRQTPAVMHVYGVSDDPRRVDKRQA